MPNDLKVQIHSEDAYAQASRIRDWTQNEYADPNVGLRFTLHNGQFYDPPTGEDSWRCPLCPRQRSDRKYSGFVGNYGTLRSHLSNDHNLRVTAHTVHATIRRRGDPTSGDIKYRLGQKTPYGFTYDPPDGGDWWYCPVCPKPTKRDDGAVAFNGFGWGTLAALRDHVAAHGLELAHFSIEIVINREFGNEGGVVRYVDDRPDEFKKAATS